MACNNALLIRYKLRVAPNALCSGSNDPAVDTALTQIPSGLFPNITKVGGISLGTEGEIEVPEWDRKARISDGKRVLPTLTLQLRVDGELPPGSLTLDFFAKWFNSRSNTVYDIFIDITRRDFSVMYTYQYMSAQIRSFKQEDQELGSTKVGLIDMEFSPYDVQLIGSDGSIIVKTTTPLP